MAKKKSAAATAQQQHFSLKEIKPLTVNQEKTFSEYKKGNHLVLSGTAGSGKSFLALYLALNQVLTIGSEYEQLIIIRSAVPTRDLGFVPGSLEEKAKIYEAPYQNITNELFSRGDAYDLLRNKNIIDFGTTSFLRGLTFSNCIIIFDEFQSATFHEIDSLLTRVGNNCKFILCGDCKQNDLNMKKEKSGFGDAMKILERLDDVSHIEFGIDDVVRSGFVKSYIIQKEKLSL